MFTVFPFLSICPSAFSLVCVTPLEYRVFKLTTTCEHTFPVRIPQKAGYNCTATISTTTPRFSILCTLWNSMPFPSSVPRASSIKLTRTFLLSSAGVLCWAEVSNDSGIPSNFRFSWRL